MAFRTWLLQFRNEDSPRGDLAYDVMYDAGTYTLGERYVEWKNHLLSMNACHSARLALAKAWRDYRRQAIEKQDEGNA